MTETLVILFIALALLSGGLLGRALRIRRASLRRLGEADDVPLVAEARRPAPVALGQARPWRAYVLGLLLGLALHRGVGLAASFAVAGGVMAALLGAQLERLRAGRQRARLEMQLADGLDLMMSALSAGTGVFHALEVAAREAHKPLRPQLEVLVTRIRYGDDPREALQALELAARLPTVRLFCAALAVHWEVGGGLTGPLAIVARTIRDRIELNRRVRAMTMQAWASVGAVMATTYFVGIIMWRTDPERMHAFLATGLGQTVIAAALILQAVGIAWSARLSRLPL